MQSINKKTVSSREIQAAVRLFVPGELCKHAVGNATRAIPNFIKYKSTNRSKKRKTSSSTHKNKKLKT